MRYLARFDLFLIRPGSLRMPSTCLKVASSTMGSHWPTPTISPLVLRHTVVAFPQENAAQCRVDERPSLCRGQAASLPISEDRPRRFSLEDRLVGAANGFGFDSVERVPVIVVAEDPRRSSAVLSEFRALPVGTGDPFGFVLGLVSREDSHLSGDHPAGRGREVELAGGDEVDLCAGVVDEVDEGFELFGERCGRSLCQARTVVIRPRRTSSTMRS